MALPNDKMPIDAYAYQNYVATKGIPSEDDDCTTLVKYLDHLGIKHFSHTPAETYTKSRTQKLRNKLLGVRAGVPDYIIILTPNLTGLTHNLLVFIEMKKLEKSEPRKEQRERLDALGFVWPNVKVAVCKWYVQARRYIESLLKPNF